MKIPMNLIPYAASQAGTGLTAASGHIWLAVAILIIATVLQVLYFLLTTPHLAALRTKVQGQLLGLGRAGSNERALETLDRVEKHLYPDSTAPPELPQPDQNVIPPPSGSPPT